MAEEVKELTKKDSTPLKNLIGAAISAVISTGLYFFTVNVAHKLALSPFSNATTLATRVAAAVRTMLLALGAGITMIFGIIALGLFLLTLQQVFQYLIKLFSPKISDLIDKQIDQ